MHYTFLESSGHMKQCRGYSNIHDNNEKKKIKLYMKKYPLKYPKYNIKTIRKEKLGCCKERKKQTNFGTFPNWGGGAKCKVK